MKIAILRNGYKIKIEDAVAEEVCKIFSRCISVKDNFTTWALGNKPNMQMISLDQIIAIVPDEEWRIIKECDNCKKEFVTGPR